MVSPLPSLPAKFLPMPQGGVQTHLLHLWSSLIPSAGDSILLQTTTALPRSAPRCGPKNGHLSLSRKQHPKGCDHNPFSCGLTAHPTPSQVLDNYLVREKKHTNNNPPLKLRLQKADPEDVGETPGHHISSLMGQSPALPPPTTMGHSSIQASLQ